jgi:hypothetical protein
LSYLNGEINKAHSIVGGSNWREIARSGSLRNRHYVDFGTTSVDPLARSRLLPRFASR